jgi:hypothetical protein
MDIESARRKQQETLQEMARLVSMKRGTITHQKVARAGGAVAVYPLLSWKEGTKTCSLRLKSAEDVAWAERATSNHQRFLQLIREYEELGEQLALSERDSGVSKEAQKKGLISRQNKPPK